MYQPPNETGTFTQVTVSGLSTMGAGNPVALLGILVGSVATSQAVNLWTQTGAAVLTGLPVFGSMVLAANTFTRVPAYLSKGLTIAVSNDAVNLTLFWNPAD